MRLITRRGITCDALMHNSALKGSGKKQGDWGEVLLEYIADNSGIVKGINYNMQVSFKNLEGSNLRSDDIIKLPQIKKNTLIQKYL
ncbi:hypothetical protein BH10BAC5_BH10BAC5_28460 [soil metagenome]